MRRGTPGNGTHQRARLVVALTLGAALGCGPDQRVGAPAAEAADTASGLLRPAADHHKHLPSPAAAELVDGAPSPPGGMVPITADQLVQQLDEAGIGLAVVLSVAYWFGAPQFELENELAQVRAENDWTARQVARYPDRLVGFCSFNPLEDYALEELERCAGELGLRGLKLHFGSSDVDVLDSEHLERVRAVFAAANRLRLPIVVHTRARSAREYGPEHALTFVNQILPAAPDVPVQIAHLWGGAGFSPPALQVFAEAVAVGHPRTRNLYFDVTDIMRAIVDSDEALTTVAARIREIGTDRILWGSDTSPPLPAPREAWLEFQALPLTDEEFRSIANNVAPYLR